MKVRGVLALVRRSLHRGVAFPLVRRSLASVGAPAFPVGGRAWLGVALLALSIASCSRSITEGEPSASHAPMASGTASRPFLEKIPNAPMNTTYGGTRHVTFSYQINDVPDTVDYTERVYSDGAGRFAVIPLTVAQPAMDNQAQELFRLLQIHREGFLYRHRDFRIRDLGLFQQNYIVSDLGPPILLCGRLCARLDMRRQSDGTSYYHVAVDVANGLILRYEEFAATGELQARVEFTDFTLTPDFTGVEFHTEQMPALPLDLGSDTTAQIGFDVHAPTLLPNSYQLEKSEQIDDGAQKWARLTYGDGAEQVFFLYSQVPAASGPSQHATDPGHHLGPPKRSVHVFHYGPWIVAQGVINEQRLTAVGKTDEQALLQMIQSAIH
jgi:hypothetical protein